MNKRVRGFFSANGERNPLPNDLCWCGSGNKYKKCHCESDEKRLYFKKQGKVVPPRRLLKNPSQIQGIRKSGQINSAVLDAVSTHLHPGMSTEEIDQIVYEVTTGLGGIPATLGYQGYPKSVCTSLNEEVCHGIPSTQVILLEGDILNVDVSTEYQGYFSDSSRMFQIGQTTPEKERLVRVARECMECGIAQVKPWHFLGDIANAVQAHARTSGYSVVREIGGHGIGEEFHEDPWVSYVAAAGTGMLLVPGMVFTVEPMINMGTARVQTASDGWTVRTADGLPSAQWEVTVLVTSDGCEILAY